jgi:hypothetical protein
LRRSVERVWASVSVRASMVTGTLFWANKMPRVVPQVVVPMMAACSLNLTKPYSQVGARLVT